MTTAIPLQVASTYFVQIQELTAHNTAAVSHKVVQAPQQSFLVSVIEPYAMYAPFVISALLFVIAFAMFFMDRVHNWKNIIGAFVIALMIAGIPAVLTYVGQGSRQAVKAGPEETPRSVQVMPAGMTSVLISWTTDAARIGAVQLGKAPLLPVSSRLYLADNQQAVSVHSVQINSLERGTSYEFELLSGATWYDNGGKFIKFTLP